MTMCTRTASKIAWQRVCSGMEMASSSALSAGYLARLILCSRLEGNVATPWLGEGYGWG